ncbi:MAG: hypothetical protein JKY65_33270 [Planctomycetes bacterium]|nr:hypothetical protein [Planctomycetota bacterium]
MADGAERELEHAAQGGDVEAEAELLRAQLRVGAIQERALARAASLGFEPARVALGPSTLPIGQGSWTHSRRCPVQTTISSSCWRPRGTAPPRPRR